MFNSQKKIQKKYDHNIIIPYVKCTWLHRWLIDHSWRWSGDLLSTHKLGFWKWGNSWGRRVNNKMSTIGVEKHVSLRRRT